VEFFQQSFNLAQQFSPTRARTYAVFLVSFFELALQDIQVAQVRTMRWGFFFFFNVLSDSSAACLKDPAFAEKLDSMKEEFSKSHKVLLDVLKEVVAFVTSGTILIEKSEPSGSAEKSDLAIMAQGKIQPSQILLILNLCAANCCGSVRPLVWTLGLRTWAGSPCATFSSSSVRTFSFPLKPPFQPRTRWCLP
jgi:hypothetical protein